MLYIRHYSFYLDLGNLCLASLTFSEYCFIIVIFNICWVACISGYFHFLSPSFLIFPFTASCLWLPAWVMTILSHKLSNAFSGRAREDRCFCTCCDSFKAGMLSASSCGHSSGYHLVMFHVPTVYNCCL